MPWRVESFVTSLGSYSPGTQRAYEHDVREFATWAERGGCRDPEAADRRVLRRYLAYLTTRGFARSSIARKVAAVRGYLRFLHRNGELPADPGRALRTPRGESRLPRVPRQADTAALLDAAATRVRDLPGEGDDRVAAALARRDLAMLEVLYGAGLRVGECCGLQRAALAFARLFGAGRARWRSLSAQRVAA
jgi:integrase/recombinase XerC